jgi:hypothetical protein
MREAVRQYGHKDVGDDGWTAFAAGIHYVSLVAPIFPIIGAPCVLAMLDFHAPDLQGTSGTEH